MDRRSFLSRTLASTALAGTALASSLSWVDLLRANADELRRTGRQCILLWMQGGPSQLETFDPKPEHENGGPTRAIKTAVEGIRIAEHWPQVAKEMKDIALIRSMTNREGNHQRASFQLHTGYAPAAGVKFPAFGSIAASELGNEASDLPNFVRVNGRGQNFGGGFLGNRHDPFQVQRADRPPQNLASSVDSARLRNRLSLLEDLEKERAAQDARVADHLSLYGRASRLSLSPRTGVFDLEKESAATRAAYGDTDFGRGCLLARRLNEAGVTFVEVQSNGWDTHNDNFGRSKTLASQVDPAFAQLIRDLRDRGSLDSTLIIWMGEFGRTPKINARTGRDHFPRAFNLALAGGGVTGGQVIGETTANGTAVKDRPVTVPDLFCSLCHSMGIDPRYENTANLGRPIKIVDGGEKVQELFA